MDKDKNEDIVDTEIVSDEEMTETSSPTVKKLREKLKTCIEEKQSYLDGWQRAKADSINYRKREGEERKELTQAIQEDIFLNIIPALDSFDMAFANKEAWEKVSKEWRIGVEYIYNQFLSILESYHIKQFVPQGEKLDPRLHIPAEIVEVSSIADDQRVLKVIQKGYKMKDKIIRPAHVTVGEYKKEEVS